MPSEQTHSILRRITHRDFNHSIFRKFHVLKISYSVNNPRRLCPEMVRKQRFDSGLVLDTGYIPHFLPHSEATECHATVHPRFYPKTSI